MKNHSLYIHIPFCNKRCSYCDFNTYVDKAGISANYMRALRVEIQKVGKSFSPIPVKTIYFGGGTPSLISIEEYEKLISVIHQYFDVRDKAEISFEANPGTLSKSYLADLIKLDINRLSLGMQTANPNLLLLLGRVHTYEDVQAAMCWARECGFTNINLDLIYGIPGQSLDDWQASLRSAVELKPDHLSLYSLTLENNVPLQKWIRQGLCTAQDPDIMADMYEWSLDFLEKGGFIQYEISNWAKMDRENELMRCEHNMQYWLNEPYLGIGAGAHGYSNGVRTENVHRIPEYIRKCFQNDVKKFPSGPAVLHTTPIDHNLEMRETMMMGLRLTQCGVSKDRFLSRFGVEMNEVFAKELNYLENINLIDYAGKNQEIARLTRKGYLLGNQAFMQFVE